MKKKITALALVLIGCLFFIHPPAWAADLEVSCGPDECTSLGTEPLFSETGMFPGKEISKVIRAINNYDEAREFAIEAVNLDSTGDLDKVLEIKIIELDSGTVVYSQNVLANFVDQYHILSEVSNLDDNFKEYEIIVNLPSWVGNNYQNKLLGFDLNLGFEMIDAEVNPTPTLTPTPSGPSNTPGAGPTNTPVPIDGCTADMPSDITNLTATGGINTVTLNWSASSPVTHYGIRYGISPGSYLYGNVDIGNTTSYVVGGLSSGFTYYFQVVPINDCQAGNWSNEVSAFVSTGAVLGEEETPPPATGFNEEEVEVLGEETEPGEVGGEGELPPGETEGITTEKICWWWLLAISALIINIIFVRKNKEKIKQNKRLWLIPAVVSISAFFGDWLAHRWFEQSAYCGWMWLLVIGSFILPFGLHYFQKQLTTS
jgi:hypothetical protein